MAGFILALVAILMLSSNSLPRALSIPGATLSPELALLWVAGSVLTTSVSSNLCSKAVSKMITSRRSPEKLAQYKCWGMEGRASGNQPWFTLVGWLILAAVSVGWTTLLAVPLLADAGIIFDETWHSRWVIWPLYLVIAIITGVWSWALDRTEVADQIGSLESLRPVFRNRFPVTEILSMRECLRVAPRIFWEEYANLPAVQVNEATNRKFRERAAPYQARRSERTQRRMLLVTALATLLAVLTLVSVLPVETLIDWISEWFRPSNTQ